MGLVGVGRKVRWKGGGERERKRKRDRKGRKRECVGRNIDAVEIEG